MQITSTGAAAEPPSGVRAGCKRSGTAFTRSPVSSAAVITVVSSPRMIMRMIFSISSWKISRCSMVRCSASWGVMGMGFSLGDSMRFRPWARP